MMMVLNIILGEQTIKFKLKKQLELPSDILQEKIDIYLRNNFYRITEKVDGHVIFIDDEYSERERYRSDYHTRIGEGKFEYKNKGKMTEVTLTYFTPIAYPIFLTMLFTAVAIFIDSFIPILFSFAFSLPVLLKIHHLNEHVFDDILHGYNNQGSPK